ncbi:MAG: SiaB family protein kinase [Spirochaetota bacterium]|nr:SiaB family protein kinase [Spirochaetota bacterium]
MLIDKLYKLKSQFNEQGIILFYGGQINHSLVEGLAQVVKQRIGSYSSANITQKVYSVFIELIQNINHYSALEEVDDLSSSDLKIGTIVIGKNKAESFYIMSGNLIESSQKDTLLKRLEKIHHLDKVELKALYKEQMRKEPEPESLGAGLGLIDIALKASEEIEYLIQDIDEIYSFFTIKVTI